AVWEVGADGTGLRQVIALPDRDITQAIYLSSLYTLDAAAPVPLIAFIAAGGWWPTGEFGVLHTCRLDGSHVERISHNPLGERDPVLLHDGRIVVSAAYSDGWTRLMSVFPDGTDVALFHGGGRTRERLGEPSESPDGRVYFVEGATDQPTTAGDLASVQSVRSLSSHRLLASAMQRTLRGPAALDADHLLVSIRADDSATFDLFTMSATSGTVERCLIASRWWHEVDARIVAPRPVPAGRSSVVDDDAHTGHLYCLNTNLMRRERNRAAELPPAARVQAFTAEQASPVAAYPVVERLLGEAPVESDGSFFLEVPARTALRLRTLDANGQAIRTCAWIWVMPMENRGCIGCHEDPEMTPPNRRVAALRQQPHVIAAPVPETPQ
ncbi:MAG TPA: hypothetical protein P5572_08660, partial [Phycisphaerae bacterium]|nr:hypothetical protein [Phycisphaerae bacterium]